MKFRKPHEDNFYTNPEVATWKAHTSLDCLHIEIMGSNSILGNFLYCPMKKEALCHHDASPNDPYCLCA